MRASVASLSKKFMSAFFAATLALGLVPAIAFAEPVQDGPVLADSADAVVAEAQDESSALEDQATLENSGAFDSVTNEFQDESVGDVSVSSDGEDGTQDDITTGDDPQVAVPAAGVINQTMPLEVVAQQESTRSYFLAQTLESTKTVPIVSANLPLDKGTNQQPQAGADGGTTVGSEDEVADGDPSASTEGESGSEPEGGDDSDESDLGVSDDASAMAPGISGESTVVGSFTYLGMTFAVEPGGETVALVAVDYSKLPEEFVQKQILAAPDAATPDGVDYYSVTRIAANAFSSLTEENANLDHTGCIALFSDEELLAEAGLAPDDVKDFVISSEDEKSALPVQNGETVTDSRGDAPAIASSPVEPTTEESPDNAIRTIVSMDGNVATLDDGSTYIFTNPLEGRAGILVLGIPASASSIEDDAFAGADTLQYVVVSEDNPEYASFDGALYSADTTNLRLIPEGRVGAVRVAPSATSADPEVFSHCPSVDALVADAESVAFLDFLEDSKEAGIELLLCRSLVRSGSSNIGGTIASLISAMHSVSFDVASGAVPFSFDSPLSSASIVDNSDTGTRTVTYENLLMYYGQSLSETDKLVSFGNKYLTDVSNAASFGAYTGTYFKGTAENTVLHPTDDDAIWLKLSSYDKPNKTGYLTVEVPAKGGVAQLGCCLGSARPLGFYDDGVPWDGGITRVDIQQKWAFQNKSIRSFAGSSDMIALNAAPDGQCTQVWVNGARTHKYISAEYKPNGATWSKADNFATRVDDSKLILTSSNGGTANCDGGSMTIRVGTAPENAPQGLPFFIGWRCASDGRVYQPGDIISDVREPLIFEAQWSGDFVLRWNAGVTDGTVIGLPNDTTVPGTLSECGLMSTHPLTALFPTTSSLPTPARGAWVFSGWYLDKNCTRPLDFAQLEKHLVDPTYTGSDKAMQIVTDRNGILDVYAGWSVRYDNLIVYAKNTVYSAASRTTTEMDATNGTPYWLTGAWLPLDAVNSSIKNIEFMRKGSSSGYAHNMLTIRIPLRAGLEKDIGDSSCHIVKGLNYADANADGGISYAFVQDSTAKLNKTARRLGEGSSLTKVELKATSKARLWINDYRKDMWLSEEYLPNGGTWQIVDANATASDDSKYYEHEGKTYDDTTATTVIVKGAPENVAVDRPVFTGWKCLQDGKIYQPGTVIQNVKEPLVFEAQWSNSFMLKWDDNAGGEQVSFMPSGVSLPATAAGSYAVCFSGIASAYPTIASLPSSPTRAGWRFAGWYLDGACRLRVVADTLRKPVISASFSGPVPSDCIRAATDGSVTLYAGWANPYDNLTVFTEGNLYVSWNGLVVSMDASAGEPYCILGDSLDKSNHIIANLELFPGGVPSGALGVRALAVNGALGTSLAYIDSSYHYKDDITNGGITKIHLQDSKAKLGKTVRRYTEATGAIPLKPDSKAKLWINDYRYSMWLSEEYLPGEGATWASVDANATSADDSKYYEHEGKTYDGTTSITVTVREAPDNAPEDRPVFLGWRCRLMDGSCMEGLLQPGDEIEDVSEPLVFEAVWTDIYNVAVPLMVGVALDPATGEARASEGASLSTTNPAQVEVVSLEYDLVEETDDLDGKGEASVPGGGTRRVFSDEEGASHLDEVSLTVLAGEAAGGGEADAVPLEVPLSAPSRLDDADALAAAGFVPFGADAGDLQLEYGLRFSLEGDDLTDMLGRLGLPEKDGLDGTSSESFPIAKLFYTIAMVERGD